MVRLRYYAHYAETDPLFRSGHVATWQVFDRENVDKSGAVRAVAMCVGKRAAYEIRDALNFDEQVLAR